MSKKADWNEMNENSEEVAYMETDQGVSVVGDNKNGTNPSGIERELREYRIAVSRNNVSVNQAAKVARETLALVISQANEVIGRDDVKFFGNDGKELEALALPHEPSEFQTLVPWVKSQNRFDNTTKISVVVKVKCVDGVHWIRNSIRMKLEEHGIELQMYTHHSVVSPVKSIGVLVNVRPDAIHRVSFQAQFNDLIESHIKKEYTRSDLIKYGIANVDEFKMDAVLLQRPVYNTNRNSARYELKEETDAKKGLVVEVPECHARFLKKFLTEIVQEAFKDHSEPLFRNLQFYTFTMRHQNVGLFEHLMASHCRDTESQSLITILGMPRIIMERCLDQIHQKIPQIGLIQQTAATGRIGRWIVVTHCDSKLTVEQALAKELPRLYNAAKNPNEEIETFSGYEDGPIVVYDKFAVPKQHLRDIRKAHPNKNKWFQPTGSHHTGFGRGGGIPPVNIAQQKVANQLDALTRKIENLQKPSNDLQPSDNSVISSLVTQMSDDQKKAQDQTIQLMTQIAENNDKMMKQMQEQNKDLIMSVVDSVMNKVMGTVMDKMVDKMNSMQKENLQLMQDMMNKQNNENLQMMQDMMINQNNDSSHPTYSSQDSNPASPTYPPNTPPHHTVLAHNRNSTSNKAQNQVIRYDDGNLHPFDYGDQEFAGGNHENLSPGRGRSLFDSIKRGLHNATSSPDSKRRARPDDRDESVGVNNRY